MTQKPLVRPQAQRDIVDIALYIGKESPASGERFLDAFEYTIDLLSQLPSFGSPCSVTDPKLKGLRAVTVRRFRHHVVLYRLLGNEVEVLRVIHGARDLRNVADEIE